MLSRLQSMILKYPQNKASIPVSLFGFRDF
jgi:hypothetical protein